MNDEDRNKVHQKTCTLFSLFTVKKVVKWI